MLYECNQVQKQWLFLKKFLKKWCKYWYTINIELDPKTIIYNNCTGPDKQMINTIIIASKRFIYVTKCYEKPLNFKEFPNFLNDIVNIEKLTASQ